MRLGWKRGNIRYGNVGDSGSAALVGVDVNVKDVHGAIVWAILFLQGKGDVVEATITKEPNCTQACILMAFLLPANEYIAGGKDGFQGDDGLGGILAIVAGLVVD